MNDTIKDEQWVKFSFIVSEIQAGKTIRVSEIFDDPYNKKNNNFRNNRGTLRAIRGFGLIAPPKKKGEWESDTVMILSEFGHYFSKHKEFSKILSNLPNSA